ncbi:fyve zinc finger domain-containing protein [Cystoisospora suis]|uniref:Fyve zinc finger domain-containing protein n=1 Tax=Cystoisospora suis TaxID=483139 RepID=A0A2C6JYW9_9APIC|nr:fyve zinc finger domain-containing protein [Cystoisospora suis]
MVGCVSLPISRNQLDALEQERAQQETRARQLEERSRSAQLEIMKLREAATERDSLREVVEDQKRQLEESQRQVEGLKQRCVTLESKAAAISVRSSGRFRDLKSTSGGSSVPTSIGDMGNGPDETGSARLRSVVGRPSNSDEFEDLAVSFTVANGLEALGPPRYNGVRGWWMRCCRCCPRRRRRGYISDYAPSRCVIQ